MGLRCEECWNDCADRSAKDCPYCGAPLRVRISSRKDEWGLEYFLERRVYQYSALALVLLLFFTLGLPVLQVNLLERRARKAGESGMINQAIELYQELWRKTKNEKYRILGSELWEEKKRREEKAGQLVQKAGESLAAGDIAAAREQAEKASLLYPDEDTLAILRKTKLETEKNEILTAGQKSEEYLNNLPFELRSRKSGMSINPKGHLRLQNDDMALILIPAGYFFMGKDEPGADHDPRRKVYLDEYWIGEKEVSAESFKRFAAETKKSWIYQAGPGGAAVGLSWDLADEYCEWLSVKHGFTDTWQYKLPSEAQWEKAARYEPQNAEYYRLFYARNITDRNFDFVSLYGLKNMLDEILEWCYDFYDADYYRNSSKKNPAGPAKGNYRDFVVRGGQLSGEYPLPVYYLRQKAAMDPDYKNNRLGFRVVLCQR